MRSGGDWREGGQKERPLLNLLQLAVRRAHHPPAIRRSAVAPELLHVVTLEGGHLNGNNFTHLNVPPSNQVQLIAPTEPGVGGARVNQGAPRCDSRRLPDKDMSAQGPGLTGKPGPLRGGPIGLDMGPGDEGEGLLFMREDKLTGRNGTEGLQAEAKRR